MIYIALALAALMAGIITSIAGGGGIVILTFLMMLDIPIKIIIGTNRVSSSFDNATSAYNYYKKGNMNVVFVKFAIIPAVLGTIIGSKLLYLVNGEVLEKVLPLILFILVGYSFFNKKVGLKNEFKGFNKKNIILGIIYAFFIGIYLGFFGMAAGNLFSFGLIYIFKFDFLEAVATVKPLLFLMGIVSLISYIIYGLVNYKYAIFITFFRIFGSMIGSNYASKKGSKFVKPVFLILCVISIGKELFL